MAERAHLSIGEVLSLLREEFPDVTISKIRFLESQGLLDPERTPSGYRKFYEEDVERLRWILRQQRENFLPLKVIKGRLVDLPDGPVPGDAPAETAGSVAAERASAHASASGPAPVSSGSGSPGTSRSPGNSGSPGASGTPGSPGTSGSPGSPGATGPPGGSGSFGGSGSPGLDGSGRGSPLGRAGDGGGRGAGGPGRPAGVGVGAGSGRVTAPGAMTGPGPGGMTGAGAGADAGLGGMAAAGLGGGAVSGSGGIAPGPSGGNYTLDELAAATGLSEAAIEELARFGLIASRDIGGTAFYDEEAATIAALAAGFAHHGVEARHLRMYKNAAERESALFEQIVMPLVKQRNPQARQQAASALEDLGRLSAELRRALLRQALGNAF